MTLFLSFFCILAIAFAKTDKSKQAVLQQDPKKSCYYFVQVHSLDMDQDGDVVVTVPTGTLQVYVEASGQTYGPAHLYESERSFTNFIKFPVTEGESIQISTTGAGSESFRIFGADSQLVYNEKPENDLTDFEVVAEAVCPSWDPCEDEDLISYDIYDMTPEQRQTFWDAIWDLYNIEIPYDVGGDTDDQSFEIQHMAFAHLNMFHSSDSVQDYCHGTPQFFACHRFMTHTLEIQMRQLKEENKCLTVPYWDLFMEAYAPGEAALFNDDNDDDNLAIGEMGKDCAKDGPLEDFEVLDKKDKQSCIKRKFKKEYQMVAYEGLFANIEEYVEMEVYVGAMESSHVTHHVWPGGQTSSGNAAYDPLFFLIHQNIDRSYTLWSDCHDYNLYSSDEVQPDVDGTDYHKVYPNDGSLDLPIISSFDTPRDYLQPAHYYQNAPCFEALLLEEESDFCADKLQYFYAGDASACLDDDNFALLQSKGKLEGKVRDPSNSENGQDPINALIVHFEKSGEDVQDMICSAWAFECSITEGYDNIEDEEDFIEFLSTFKMLDNYPDGVESPCARLFNNDDPICGLEWTRED